MGDKGRLHAYTDACPLTDATAVGYANWLVSVRDAKTSAMVLLGC